MKEKTLLNENDKCLYWASPQLGFYILVRETEKGNIFFEYTIRDGLEYLFEITEDYAKKLLKELDRNGRLSTTQTEECQKIWSDF